VCNELLLSTDSPEDLTRWNTDLLVFSKDLPDSPFLNLLDSNHKWYIGSREGCSCGFRHLINQELGFGPPVDWYEEDPQDLAATIEFVKVARHLLELGHSVDCIDYWFTSPVESCQTQDVNLSLLSDSDFRFFQNFHFRLTNSSQPSA